MRSRSVARCSVLVLVALLALDASWCCDEITTQPSSSVLLMSAGAACAGDAGQLDCHACICSGLALVEITAMHMPVLMSTALMASSAGAPPSETPSIDVPPDERC